MISVSEAWTPKDKSNKKSPLIKSLHVLTVLKSGCGFYAKEELKNKPRKNLDLNIMVKTMNFKVFEILSNKKPLMVIGLYDRHSLKNLRLIYLTEN